MNSIIKSFYLEYDDNKLKSSWDFHILSVYFDEKDVALTENDLNLNYTDNDVDLFLRYTLLHNSNIKYKQVHENNDPTFIWYKQKNWSKACLLYLYHKGHIEIPGNQLEFDLFQGILLGYTYESSITYINSQKYKCIANQSDKSNLYKYETLYNTFIKDSSKPEYIDSYNNILSFINDKLIIIQN